MTVPLVRIATSADEKAASDTVVLAFAADPIARWCWPESRQYLANMPAFVRAFGGRAFLHGSAHCTQDCGGVAMWLPPLVNPDEQLVGELVEGAAPSALRSDLVSMLMEMSGHRPKEPHWYLPLIGVDPVHQSKGNGSALLAHALEKCDRDGLPAYLESTNPRNITLYQRHGFKAVGAIQAGSSPTVVPMLRPRS